VEDEKFMKIKIYEKYLWKIKIYENLLNL